MNTRQEISDLKNVSSHRASLRGALLAAIFLGATPVVAEEPCPVAEAPRVTVAPSPIYVSGAGPWSQALAITVDLIDNLPSYDTLELKFDGDLAYSGAKATGGHTICSNKTGGSGTCASGSTASQIVVSYTASFSELRSYAVEVDAQKSGPNDVCETAHFVVLEFVAAEFKAPPAIANEFINDFYSDLSGKRRGCVISKIAGNHAKDSKYGPKGGDAGLWPGTGYNVDAIHADVNNYFGDECRR